MRHLLTLLFSLPGLAFAGNSLSLTLHDAEALWHEHSRELRLADTAVTGAVADGGPIPGFGVVEIGAAAALKPDVVLVLNSGQGGLAAQVSSDPAWAASAAVQQKRIIDLDITLFLRAPGPRAGEALETLAKLLWP